MIYEEETPDSNSCSFGAALAALVFMQGVEF